MIVIPNNQPDSDEIQKITRQISRVRYTNSSLSDGKY